MDQQAAPGFLAGGGGCGALMRALDWSATPLGPPSAWPQALTTLVGVALGSRQPMLIVWGKERTTLYNDGYAEMCGARHPAALGRPFDELWHDIWDQVEPIVARAYAGEPTRMDDIAFTMHRDGRPEETHFAFGYTPVRDEAGRVAGMFCACVETTKQVVAERDLRASEERFRILFDQQFQFMAVLSPEGVTLEINGLPLRAAGLAREEVVGRLFWDAPFWAGLPDMQQGWPGRLAEAARTEGPVLSEDRYRAAGGEIRTADAAVTAVKDPSGGVRFFVIQATDVTERRRAEEALRGSEAEARRLAAQQAATLDQLAEGVIVADADGRITLINDAAVRLHGVKRLDIVPDGYSATYHLLTEDGRPYPSLDLPLARAVRGETVQEARWRIRRPDGGEVLAVGNAKPVLDGAGRQIGAVLTIRDDTARRAAEQALERLNKALEGTVAERTLERDEIWRVSQDMLLIIGRDGVIRAVNPAWTRSLGYGHDELVGVRFDSFVAPDDVEASYAALERAAEGVLPRFENRYRHKDGTWRNLAWTAAPSGSLVYCVARDVTLDKQREAELARAQEELRQSQKMEAVGQLTGGIAHDFNNLLTGITGSLEMLNTRISQGRIAEVDRYTAAARGAAKRAAALTHRLLAFSRRQTLDPKPTDVNRLVAGMEDLVRRTVGPEIAVEAVAAGGLWTTLVDPHQLENALLNLCINARDAMPDGGKLTIETGNKWLDQRAARERDLPPGQYVTLCVSDTGTGMTPEVVRRAFDPFFTTKPIGMGTGLGLSMIYGFVRQSGGQARIYSEPGQGAMVCLYLPRHLGKAENGDAPPGPADAPRAEQGETVLVVDDEPTVRMLVADVLGDLGYTAIEAADGAAGLKVLRSPARIDLLVTDVGLPGGMNGRQVADAARALRPGLKVLFITGYAENAVLGHGHLDPGMHVLTKPFAMETLASRIKDVIDGA